MKTFSLRNINKLFITDIGSTTTKGLLLVKQDGKWIFFCQADSNTTVELPYEDINIGVISCFNKMIKAVSSQHFKSLDLSQVPYMTTSSAGGGLQMISFGLLKAESGKIADITVLDAGAVLVKSFAIDDKLPDEQKIRLIRSLNPDMILMAGGHDGGKQAGIIHFITLLTEAFSGINQSKSDKTPLVFCGNKDMREYIYEFLHQYCDVFLTENIRPNMKKINILPAKKVIHELFKTKVMQKAPGFANLQKIVSYPIQPTPVYVKIDVAFNFMRFSYNYLFLRKFLPLLSIF